MSASATSPIVGAGWNDLRFPFTRDKQGQSDKPDFNYAELGLLFPQNDSGEQVNVIAQMPHTYREETSLKLHVHYVQDTADEPVFKADYRWYNNGEDPSGAFTTITAATFAYTYSSGSILQVVSFPDVSGVGKLISSLVDIKFYRDDNVVTGDVLVKEFDIHYQIDRPAGSRQEFVK